jgi:hypothetical protein
MKYISETVMESIVENVKFQLLSTISLTDGYPEPVLQDTHRSAIDKELASWSHCALQFGTSAALT